MGLFKKNTFFQNSFAKNSSVLFGGTILVSFLNYVFHLVVGRAVSAEVYGEAEALISLIAIISVPATTLTMVATKYVAACKSENDKRGSREILDYLSRKILKYGVPLFFLAVAATPFAADFLNVRNNFSLILIWVSMLVSFFAAINSGILRGWQKFKDVSVSGVWGTSAKLVFGVALVKSGFALNGIIGAFTLGSLVAYAATFFALQSVVAKKEGQILSNRIGAIDFKSLKRFIMPVFVGNLAITILGNVDMVLAKRNLDALTAGQYGALSVVSKMIFFATGIIAGVLFSMSAENSHSGNSSRHILKTALIIVAAASFGATLVYFMYPALILNILFGGKYQDVAPYLGWFAVAVAFFSVANVVFQYLLSIHKTKISYVLLVIACVLSGLIFFYGHSINAILVITIFSQIAALGIGSLFLFERKRPNILVKDESYDQI